MTSSQTPGPLDVTRLRYVVQRAKAARLTADGHLRGTLDGPCLVVFFGIGLASEHGAPQTVLLEDFPVAALRVGLARSLEKILAARVFSDDEGRMNRALHEARAGVVLVSQFTLFANCRKGNRPSFGLAWPPGPARIAYDNLESLAAARSAEVGFPLVTGVFGAHMEVSFTNDGPVTLCLEFDAAGQLVEQSST